MPERRVVIWRSAMLPGSETFVRHPADALTRWTASFAGATRVDSPLAREADLIAYPDGNFLPLRLTGRSPHLERLLAGLRPDLVHAHFAGDAWLVSGSARRLGVPLVVTVHGHDVTRQPQTGGAKGVRYRRNLRSVFARAALILAVSEEIRQRAIRWGADPAKVRVHHTGVPIPPMPAAGVPRWDVAFVGRFVPKKGADDLLAALATLGPDVRPVFVGDGPLLPGIRASAAELRVPATFTGSLPPAGVMEVLGSSKLLGAPSRTAPDGDTEGLPTTIVEAAALGLPVVATRHSGIPEAVIDGETGLLGPEGDRPALAAGLKRLLGDDDLRLRMGRRAREFAVASFDVVTQAGRLEDLYDEAVRLPDSR